MNRFASLWIVLGCLVFSACENGPVSVSLVDIQAEPAGATCSRGGQVALIGLDGDGDSELGADEVDSAVYACDGEGRAAALDVLSADPSDECPAGGNLVSFGVDLDLDGALSPPETRGSALVCDGVADLLVMQPLAPGPACAAGGVEIRSGRDADGDLLLEAGEQVGASRNVCDAAGGFNSLVRVTPIESGLECLAGGTLTQTGLDLDRDGALDGGEITDSVRQCNPCAARDGGACARGEFTAQPALPLPTATFRPDGVVAGDLNDDGRTDLVMTSPSRTQAWLGVDGGVFGPQRSSTSDYVVNRFAVKLADLDRDFKADLIGVNSSTSRLLVRQGNGDGTFGPLSSFATCGGPTGVEVADFNGDSMLDVAVSCTASPAIRLFYGTGSATAFADPVDFLPTQTMRVPFGLAAGDVDGDGDTDLVVAGFDELAILENTRLGGTFQVFVMAPALIDSGEGFDKAKLADMDGDGDLDVIASASDTFGRSRLHAYRNDGGGRFSEPSEPYLITGTFINLEVGFVNGDTVPDVVVAERTDGPFGPETTTSVQVLLGKRDFSFQKGQALTFPGFSLDLKLGHFDPDGRLDLVVTDEDGFRLLVFRGL